MSDPRKWLDTPEDQLRLDRRLVRVGKDLGAPEGTQALVWSNLAAVLGPGLVGAPGAPPAAAAPSPSVGSAASSSSAGSGIASASAVSASAEAAGPAVGSHGLAGLSAVAAPAVSTSMALVLAKWAAIGAALGTGAIIGIPELRDRLAPGPSIEPPAVLAAPLSSPRTGTPHASEPTSERSATADEAAVSRQGASASSGEAVSEASRPSSSTRRMEAAPAPADTTESMGGTSGPPQGYELELPAARSQDTPPPLPGPGFPPPFTEENVRPPSPRAAAQTRELRAEALRLAEARNLLERGNAKAALAVLSRHDEEARVPALSHEREALTVEALWRAGHQEAARHRARVFVNRFPTSSLAPRVSHLVGLE